jgi:hypothetical protein
MVDIYPRRRADIQIRFIGVLREGAGRPLSTLDTIIASWGG